MADPQALATFPGVEKIVSFRGAFQHGRTPSSFQLTITPQAQPIKGTGDLQLFYGQTRIKLTDCIIDSASYQFDESGFLIGLNIFDRRWKWRYPTISGMYNQTDDAGLLIDSDGANNADTTLINSKRTPQQLAKLLLEAMKEQNYDVSQLPNDVFPRVDWAITNASSALAELCEQLGCRIVLGLDNKVRLVRLGKGKPLPNLPFVDAQLDINPPETPSRVRIFSAPILYQADFQLEAVGLETDGTIKKIDDLSYKPAAGWASSDARYFTSIVNADHRKLAMQSVFRWYRVVLPARFKPAGPVQPIKLQDRREIVLDDRQVEKDTEGDRQRRRPAWCFGVWYNGDFSHGVSSFVTAYNGNTAAVVSPITANTDRQFVTVPFEIDDDNKIIRFSGPVYKLVLTTGTLGAAELRLRTGFRLRDYRKGNLERLHQGREVKNARGKTEPMDVIREDIEPTCRAKYTAAYADNGSVENSVTVSNQLKYYLDSTLAEFNAIENPEAKKYPAILAQELDGAIQSVAWEIGPRGGYTVVQRNQDRGSPGIVPYALKRQAERAKFRQDQAKVVLDVIERAARNAKG